MDRDAEVLVIVKETNIVATVVHSNVAAKTMTVRFADGALSELPVVELMLMESRSQARRVQTQRGGWRTKFPAEVGNG